MARRRRRARSNPSTGAWVAIGAGVVALGVGVYFLTKSSSSSNAPQLNPATGQPLASGDKLIQVSIPGQSGSGIIPLSQACAAAGRLHWSGATADAAAWAKVCTDNGGTVNYG